MATPPKKPGAAKPAAKRAVQKRRSAAEPEPPAHPPDGQGRQVHGIDLTTIEDVAGTAVWHRGEWRYVIGVDRAELGPVRVSIQGDHGDDEYVEFLAGEEIWIRQDSDIADAPDGGSYITVRADSLLHPDVADLAGVEVFAGGDWRPLQGVEAIASGILAGRVSVAIAVTVPGGDLVHEGTFAPTPDMPLYVRFTHPVLAHDDYLAAEDATSARAAYVALGGDEDLWPDDGTWNDADLWRAWMVRTWPEGVVADGGPRPASAGEKRPSRFPDFEGEPVYKGALSLKGSVPRVERAYHYGESVVFLARGRVSKVTHQDRDGFTRVHDIAAGEDVYEITEKTILDAVTACERDGVALTPSQLINAARRAAAAALDDLDAKARIPGLDPYAEQLERDEILARDEDGTRNFDDDGGSALEACEELEAAAPAPADRDTDGE